MKRGKHSDLRARQGNNHCSYCVLSTVIEEGLWKLILKEVDEINSAE